MLTLKNPKQKVAYSPDTLRLLQKLKNDTTSFEDLEKIFFPQNNPTDRERTWFTRLITNAMIFDLITQKKKKYKITKIGKAFLKHCTKKEASDRQHKKYIAKLEDKLLKKFKKLKKKS